MTKLLYNCSNIASEMTCNVLSQSISTLVYIALVECKVTSDHHKNISVPCSARLDFHELIKSNNRLLNE